MLNRLIIKNYAIIDRLEIAFDEHLNIITGETGAGKSILLGALNLILGERADTKVLYNQEDKCVVEANFAIQQKERITLGEVRDMLDTTRKYIQALLEHLDAIGVTMRDGDARKLRK